MNEPTITLEPPEMVTEFSTNGLTVSTTFPVTVVPVAVAEAVIVADPAASAVTSPLALTLATVGADELHVTIAAIALPF